jgi:hypothetical protein
MTVGDYIGIGYLVMGGITWWIAVGVLAWGDRYSERGLPDGGNIAFGAGIGIILGLIWPIALPTLLMVGREPNPNYKSLMYCPPKYKKERDELMRRVQQERIKELERELELERR